MIYDWTPCIDKKTKFCYWVKETKEDGIFELLFSFYPDYEDGWKHGGTKFVAKNLKEFRNSIYYKKYQSENVSNGIKVV